MKMRKFFKSILRFFYKIFKVLYRIVDKLIVMPISRIVYNINKSTGNNSNINKILNRPQFLIVLSLVFAVICFILINNKVINLVENEAEVIKNVPVTVLYNEETYIVEDAPETVDIILTGRKSDIYLAKQLGDFNAELDLTRYTRPGTYRVRLKSSEAINSVNYTINPGYVTIAIKDRVSEERTVTYDLVGTDELDKKLSVGSVNLDSTMVVVKGSSDALKSIASVKALVSVGSDTYKEANTYEVTNIPVVAYDKNGNTVKNIDIVPKTLSGTLVLKSYKQTVPLTVSTTGNLATGKAIASVTINNSAQFAIDIYGEENDIKAITSVPITIDVDGRGSESAKNYNVAIRRPNGVRFMSLTNVTVTVSFGDEEQKTIDVQNIDARNLKDGYSANIVSKKTTPVQVKGVKSNIDKITANDIRTYVDLTDLTEGTHEVEIKVDNDNPLIKYIVSNTATIQIKKD